MNVPEISKQFFSGITIADIIIFLPGVIIFGIWLLKTSLGRKALAESMPRRNNMPVYLPFIPLLIWFGAVSLAMSIKGKLLPDLADWQIVFLDNLILCIGAIVAIAVIIFLARARFARRLKGFGLNAKTIHKDFFAGVLNLLCVWPLLILVILLTMFVGKVILGQDFEMQQHQELELIAAYPQLPVRVLIVITTVAIVPIFEEMLFRGMFQTMLRSFLDARCSADRRPVEMLDAQNHQSPITNYQIPNRAWLSIAISSGLFATVHAEPAHWPALFVLSACLGYSYERSGSLFRPIFIHSLFNASSVIAALYQ